MASPLSNLAGHTPSKGVVPRPPRAPKDRTITLKVAFETIIAQVAEGTLQVGHEVGECGPYCGPIVIKSAGPASGNPGKKYAACPAPSEAKHGSFFWVEGGSATEPRELFPPVAKVPHALSHGMRGLPEHAPKRYMQLQIRRGGYSRHPKELRLPRRMGGRL